MAIVRISWIRSPYGTEQEEDEKLKQEFENWKSKTYIYAGMMQEKLILELTRKQVAAGRIAVKQNLALLGNQLASASVVLFLGFGVRICSAGPVQLPLTPIVTQQDQLLNQGTEQEEDEKLKQEFENWKSKTYALTLPLRMNLCASIGGIFNNVPFNKVKGKSASYTAADLVSVGDSWLSFVIKKRLIEPIAEAEDQDWFKCLCHEWKSFYLFVYLLLFALTKSQVYLRRNDAGEIDPRGKIWAAPYRWGTTVIAHKKSKFRKHNLAPIEVIIVFKLI
ncbi:hypothetical protein CUMW_149400 [Citrus unshiu]|nr:hypothetical protein CUMW_149400 [Citrus unshiu]